jgi:hypothetical protein
MPESLFDRFATALVVALATTLIAVLSEWLKRRGHDARVKQDVDQAISRVNFLSAWLTLQERLSNRRPRPRGLPYLRSWWRYAKKPSALGWAPGSHGGLYSGKP